MRGCTCAVKALAVEREGGRDEQVAVAVLKRRRPRCVRGREREVRCPWERWWPKKREQTMTKTRDQRWRDATTRATRDAGEITMRSNPLSRGDLRYSAHRRTCRRRATASRGRFCRRKPHRTAPRAHSLHWTAMYALNSCRARAPGRWACVWRKIRTRVRRGGRWLRMKRGRRPTTTTKKLVKKWRVESIRVYVIAGRRSATRVWPVRRPPHGHARRWAVVVRRRIHSPRRRRLAGAHARVAAGPTVRRNSRIRSSRASQKQASRQQ